ncbi:MAG: class I SAM-dependent methyltransferase [Planctomycetaceae bacterium]
MVETINASIYDFPTYYDLVFGSDWQAEYRFLRGCFEKHASRPVRRVFEPACGTGRLLIKFAEAGFQVCGNDLNRKAVDFCNARLVRRGYRPTALVGDMADFRVKRTYDAAFNMINSFRHLDSDVAAESHLRCMSAALADGGLYVLGLHLLPTKGESEDREEWSARRGNLAIISSMRSEWIDGRFRNEHLGITFDVYTPTRHFQIADAMDYRTYTAAQMRRLLARVPEFEIVATYDFAYELDQPVVINATTQDVVFVLRKRSVPPSRAGQNGRARQRAYQAHSRPMSRVRANKRTRRRK